MIKMSNEAIQMMIEAVQKSYETKTKEELIFSLKTRDQYIDDVLTALSEKEVIIASLEEKIKFLNSSPLRN